VRPICVTHAAATILGVCLLLSISACSATASVPAAAGDELLPGRPVSADLDSDGTAETILLDEHGSLHIEGDSSIYRSREQWQVAQAFLGDTDGNGLLEVVALLDDSRGRHLGLFAWMGDRFRERIVTSVLTPRPLSLQVVPATPSLVILDEERPSAPGGVVRTTYRWNGFGFTAVGEVIP